MGPSECLTVYSKHNPEKERFEIWDDFRKRKKKTSKCEQTSDKSCANEKTPYFRAFPDDSWEEEQHFCTQRFLLLFLGGGDKFSLKIGFVGQQRVCEFKKPFLEHASSLQQPFPCLLVSEKRIDRANYPAFLHEPVSSNASNVLPKKTFFSSRGMKFENVSILIDNIKDIIKDVRYCW